MRIRRQDNERERICSIYLTCVVAILAAFGYNVQSCFKEKR